MGCGPRALVKASAYAKRSDIKTYSTLPFSLPCSRSASNRARHNGDDGPPGPLGLYLVWRLLTCFVVVITTLLFPPGLYLRRGLWKPSRHGHLTVVNATHSVYLCTCRCVLKIQRLLDYD